MTQPQPQQKRKPWYQYLEHVPELQPDPPSDPPPSCEYLARVAKEAAVDALLVHLYRSGDLKPVLRSEAEDLLDTFTSHFIESRQP
jgi:hypothetical protein